MSDEEKPMHAMIAWQGLALCPQGCSIQPCDCWLHYSGKPISSLHVEPGDSRVFVSMRGPSNLLPRRCFSLLCASLRGTSWFSGPYLPTRLRGEVRLVPVDTLLRLYTFSRIIPCDRSLMLYKSQARPRISDSGRPTRNE